MIDAAIAEGVRDSSVALSPHEEHALTNDVSHAVDSLTVDEILRDLIDATSREDVQAVLDMLS